MGGVVSPVTKALGLRREDGGRGTVADQIKEMGAKPSAAVDTAAREEGEERAARRRVRRGGQRALLSEARLNPEQGISTLGQTGL